MTDVEAGLAREPHPFVNAHYMSRMEGQTVAICGKVDKVEANSFTLRTSDGKSTLDDKISVKSPALYHFVENCGKHLPLTDQSANIALFL